MARVARKVGLTFLLLVVAAYAGLLAYSLPRTLDARVLGTEVKRMGDVEDRFIIVEDLDGGSRMFLNVDTGWSFPFYFKFDSGTVAAQAMNLAKKHPDQLVRLRYYGVRAPMFSAFPNVLSIRNITEGEGSFPLFSVIFLSLHAIAIGYVAIKVRRWRRKRLARKAELAPAGAATE